MMVKNSLDTLCNLLAPLNKASGEHSVYVTVSPGTERGFIEFRFNWKTIYRELEFSSYRDAINKSEKIMGLVASHPFFREDSGSESCEFKFALDELLDKISTSKHSVKK